MKNKNGYNLKQSEINILNVLWNENLPLQATEVAAKGSLNLNTTRLAIHELLDKGLVKVDDVVICKKSLSRKYIPTISREEYENRLLAINFKEIIKKSNNNPTFLAALLSQDDIVNACDEINSLQDLLNEYRATLEKKEN